MMRTSNTASITVQDRDISVNRTTLFTKKGIFVEFQFCQQNDAAKIGHHPLLVHLSVAVMRIVCTRGLVLSTPFETFCGIEFHCS